MGLFLCYLAYQHHFLTNSLAYIKKCSNFAAGNIWILSKTANLFVWILSKNGKLFVWILSKTQHKTQITNVQGTQNRLCIASRGEK